MGIGTKLRTYTMESYSICSKTFTEHLVNSRKELYEDTTFTDVTLVTDEMVPIQAHKSVLVTASSTFKKLLLLNPQSDPILYLRGVQKTDLETILKLANELDLKDFGSNSSVNLQNQSTQEISHQEAMLREALDELQNGSQSDTNSAMEDIGAKKETLMKKSLNTVVKMETAEDIDIMCKECGKSFSNEWNLKRHVKSVHEEVEYPCKYCDKKYNHKGNVKRHEYQAHSSVSKNH